MHHGFMVQGGYRMAQTQMPIKIVETLREMQDYNVKQNEINKVKLQYFEAEDSPHTLRNICCEKKRNLGKGCTNGWEEGHNNI